MKNISALKLFVGSLLITAGAFVLSATILSDLLTVFSWFIFLVVATPLFVWGAVKSRREKNIILIILNGLALALILLLAAGVGFLLWSMSDL